VLALGSSISAEKKIGAPGGSYTITVTAPSGAASTAKTVTFTVNIVK
jgi:hypothetical protein